MSGVIDLPLVMLQKAQNAAELLESEVGQRLTSIEARMVGVEGRLTTLAAGQSAHELSLMRIADTQSEHTARFDAIDKRLDAIDQALTDILGKLA